MARLSFRLTMLTGTPSERFLSSSLLEDRELFDVAVSISRLVSAGCRERANPQLLSEDIPACECGIAVTSNPQLPYEEQDAQALPQTPTLKKTLNCKLANLE